MLSCHTKHRMLCTPWDERDVHGPQISPAGMMGKMLQAFWWPDLHAEPHAYQA